MACRAVSLVTATRDLPRLPERALVKISSAFVVSAALLSFHFGPGCSQPAVPGAAAEPAELDPKTATVFGERALLFMEYPPLVAGESARFLAHLSVLADGEPVRSGRVRLEVGSFSLAVEAPARDGLFVPEGAFASPGTFPARLVIESPQVTETLALGDVVVHSGEADARTASEADSGDEPPGAVPFLMEQQWKVSLLLAEAVPRRLARRLSVPAQAAFAEGASAVVSAPVAGRLVVQEGGAWPRTGDRVDAGRMLALVEPTLSAADLSQLRVAEWDFDRQALGIEQELAAAGPPLTFAEAAQARVAKLRVSGLSTQQQLDEAEMELELARSRMTAARAAKDALDRLRQKHADTRGGPSSLTLRVPVFSPIRGVVAESGHAVGESVEAADVLFRIVDESRLWIVGSLSEFDLAGIGASPQATVRFAALPDVQVTLGDRDGGRLLHIAPAVDAVSRTVAIRFELPNPDGTIRAGMLADLELAVGEVDAAVTIPLDAVVMHQGRPVAYVMLEGELFQQRELELGVRDGQVVEVRAGIQPGERVATRGSATIRLVSLSPASFGAGHAH